MAFNIIFSKPLIDQFGRLKAMTFLGQYTCLYLWWNNTITSIFFVDHFFCIFIGESRMPN